MDGISLNFLWPGKAMGWLGTVLVVIAVGPGLLPVVWKALIDPG